MQYSIKEENWSREFKRCKSLQNNKDSPFHLFTFLLFVSLVCLITGLSNVDRFASLFSSCKVQSVVVLLILGSFLPFPVVKYKASLSCFLFFLKPNTSCSVILHWFWVFWLLTYWARERKHVGIIPYKPNWIIIKFNVKFNVLGLP